MQAIWNKSKDFKVRECTTRNSRKIADNLNPIMPKFKTFLQISKDIAIGGQLSKRDGEKYVADFLKSMTDVITPRRYSKMLSDLNFKIDSYMNEYHRDKINYFILFRIQIKVFH